MKVRDNPEVSDLGPPRTSHAEPEPQRVCGLAPNFGPRTRPDLISLLLLARRSYSGNYSERNEIENQGPKGSEVRRMFAHTHSARLCWFATSHLAVTQHGSWAVPLTTAARRVRRRSRGPHARPSMEGWGATSDLPHTKQETDGGGLSFYRQLFHRTPTPHLFS